MRYMIDMYAGLGGASEAMVRSDKWEVLRLDNNPLLDGVKNMRIVDVLFCDTPGPEILPIPADMMLHLFWASPPCLEFSNAYNAPKSIARRNDQEFSPDLSLVYAALEWIESIQPKYWVIENVVGAIEHLTPILGPPRQIIGAFVLWGNFPMIHLDRKWKHLKADSDTHNLDPLRANYKALVPFEISFGLMEAIESQTSLFDF